MDVEKRKEELSKIRFEGKPQQTGLKLYYGNTSHVHDAFMIPLDLLIYNKYNGRIGAQVKSYERVNKSLDPENKHDVEIIEKFLWDSKLDRNKKTRDGLLEEGQRLYGIVTNDGRIIDGNRRACLLKSIMADGKISYEKKSHCSKFLAIILPEDMEKKDIMMLETSIQMGEEEKVDYDPIEKYLKCKDLIDEGFTTKDISSFMKIEVKKVEEYLDILRLMNEYLEYCGYNGLYTMLSKTEDPFINLDKWMKSYTKRTAKADWKYRAEDISELKMISFDYIRARYEGKEFRDIGSTSRGGSIFKTHNAWDAFKENHFKNITPAADEERPVSEYRREIKGGDITKVLEARDGEWREKVKENLKTNLKDAVDIKDGVQQNNPLKQLDKVETALKSIDPSTASFKNGEVLPALQRVERHVANLIKSWGQTDV